MTNPTTSEIGIYTGLRKGNIRKLKIEQITFHDLTESGEIYFVSKGDKRQIKPLGKAALKLLNEVIGDRKEGCVFLNRRTGKCYSRSGFNSFDKVVIRLGLKALDGSKFWFHDLRHSLAWFLKNLANASLDDIREILGHANRSTTDRYTTYSRQVVGLLNQVPSFRG